jgi:hypothetical protein
MPKTKTPAIDFSKETVDQCETHEELVQSELFTKALEKTLEPQDVQYIQAIVSKRVAGESLNPREEAYLSGIQADEELMSKFTGIINIVEYIEKKK